MKYKSILFVLLLCCSTLQATILTGKTDDILSVSPSGNVNYSIPLNLKSGISSFTPQLSLVYSGQTTNGPLGIGWSISGISSISIVPRNVHFDTKAEQLYQSPDNAYSLDGNRLLLVSGGNGMSGSRYRTENDQYNVISIEGQAGNTPKSFIVKATDGSIYRYGSATGRLTYNGNSACSWMLDYAEDILGNFIRYEYTTDNLTLRLNKITYGQNKHNSNSIPLTVIFEYSSRNDSIPVHIFESNGFLSKRLSNIICQYGGQTYRSYSLQYANESPSRLTSVTEHGIGEAKYPAVNFTWQQAPDSLSVSTSSVQVQALQGKDQQKQYFFSGDIDNDGHSELISIYDTLFNMASYSAPYVDMQVWKKDNVANIFRPQQTYSTQSGVIVSEAIRAMTMGGTLAHVSHNDQNSLVMPYFINSSGECAIGFHFFKEQLELSYPLKSSTEMPVYFIADYDRDGLDEIIYIEKQQQSGSYPACIISTELTQGSLQGDEFTLNLPEKPTRIISSDFNADGMTDILVTMATRYCIYWNNAGMFSDAHKTSGNQFGECDILELGDFNGDNLPDLLVNKHNSSVWLLAINTGKASTGLFNTHSLPHLSGDNAMNKNSSSKDDERFYCIVQDFDGDMKSDIIAAYANYNNGSFVNGKIKHLKSEGTIFSAISTVTFTNENDFPKRNQIVHGDFNGDGVAEILFHGKDLWSGGNSGWYRWDICNLLPSTRRITAIDNGRLVRHIQYGLLTNDSVYTSTSTHPFPILNLQAPIPVVKEITAVGNTETISTKYSYNNALFHWQGKAFLGFENVNAKSSKGITEVSEFALHSDYHVLYPTKKTEYAENGTKIRSEEYGYRLTPINGKSFFMYNAGVTRRKHLSGHVQTESSSTYVNGQPESRGFDDDNYFQENNEYSYWEYPDSDKIVYGLPALVITTKTNLQNDEEVESRTTYTRNPLNGLIQSLEEKRGNLRIRHEQFSYNACGQVLRKDEKPFNAPTALSTVYTYDQYGRIQSETDPLGRSTTYTYDIYGNKSSETDYLGVTTTFLYDGMHRRVSSSSAVVSDSVAYLPSNYGNSEYKVVSISSDAPTQTEYFDAFDRKTAQSEKHFDGRELYTDFSYLPSGELGFKSFPHFQGVGQSGGTSYTYDLAGRLLRSQDSNGKTNSYTYEGKTVTSSENGVSYTTEYIAEELALFTEDSEGGYVETEYNAERKPLTIYHNDLQTTFSYDTYGRLAESHDMNGTIRAYSYDSLGYLNAEIFAGGRTSIMNDRFGRSIYETVTSQNGLDTLVRYTYNNLQQLVSEHNQKYRCNYSYDQYGRISNETRYVFADSTESVSYTYHYGNGGNLVRKDVELGTSCLSFSEHYSYQNGWLTSVRLDTALVWQLTAEDQYGTACASLDYLNSHTRTFDVYGHLLEQNISGYQNVRRTYGYDIQTGNMTMRDSISYGYDEMNRLVSQGSSAPKYAYDSEGNLTSMSGVGNLTYSGFKLSGINNASQEGSSSEEWKASYLQAIQRPSVFQEGRKRAKFHYGGDRQRIRMDYSIASSDSTLTSPDSIKEMRFYPDKSYEVVVPITGAKRHYYYVGGDAYSAKAMLYACGDTVRLYQMYRDMLGSVILYASKTDTQELHYSPWGGRTLGRDSIQPATPGNIPAIRFTRTYTGHEELTWFGLYNANARLYNPYYGRFLSPDPILATEGMPLDFNPYVYARNNPFTYTDPTGEIPIWIIAAVALGGATNLYTNWDNIDNWGDGFLYFFVGAGASAAAFIPVGGLAVQSGFLAGATAGAIESIIPGALLGMGNAAIQGEDIGQAAINNALTSALTGGLSRGLSSGMDAIKTGKDFWKGIPKHNKGIPKNLDAFRKEGIAKLKNQPFAETNNGEHQVYAIMNKDKVEYIGRTKRTLDIRYREHLRKHPDWEQFDIIPLEKGLNYKSARFMEQYYLNSYKKIGEAQFNKINSIAPRYWDIWGLE